MPRVLVPTTELTPPKSSLTTALAGANNDLVYTARQGGPGGNSIRVQYIVGAGTATLSVAVEGYDILVTVATTTGTPTSTASAVKAAVEAHSDATRLVTVANAAANDGTGVVAALALTALAGGSLATVPPTPTDGDSVNGHYITAADELTYLEVVSTDASSRNVTIEFSPYYAPLVDVPGEVIAIAAGATRLLGPFSPSAFHQNASRDIYFTPSVSTTIDFRAYRLVRAA